MQLSAEVQARLLFAIEQQALFAGKTNEELALLLLEQINDATWDSPQGFLFVEIAVRLSPDVFTESL